MRPSRLQVLWVYPLALVMGFFTLGVVYLIQNFVNRAWYFLLPPQLPSVPMLCLTLVVISVFTLLGSILSCFVTGRRGLYMAICLVIGLGVYPWILGEPAQTSHYGPRDWVAVGVLAPVLGLAQGPIPSLLADMFDTSTLMTGLGLVFWGGHTLMNILWPLLLRLPDIEEQKVRPAKIAMFLLLTASIIVKQTVHAPQCLYPSLHLFSLSLRAVSADAAVEHAALAAALGLRLARVCRGARQRGRRMPHTLHRLWPPTPPHAKPLAPRARLHRPFSAQLARVLAVPCLRGKRLGDWPGGECRAGE